MLVKLLATPLPGSVNTWANLPLPEWTWRELCHLQSMITLLSVNTMLRQRTLKFCVRTVSVKHPLESKNLCLYIEIIRTWMIEKVLCPWSYFEHWVFFIPPITSGPFCFVRVIIYTMYYCSILLFQSNK